MYKTEEVMITLKEHVNEAIIALEVLEENPEAQTLVNELKTLLASELFVNVKDNNEEEHYTSESYYDSGCSWTEEE